MSNLSEQTAVPPVTESRVSRPRTTGAIEKRKGSGIPSIAALVALTVAACGGSVRPIECSRPDQNQPIRLRGSLNNGQGTDDFYQRVGIQGDRKLNEPALEEKCWIPPFQATMIMDVEVPSQKGTPGNLRVKVGNERPIFDPKDVVTLSGTPRFSELETTDGKPFIAPPLYFPKAVGAVGVDGRGTPFETEVQDITSQMRGEE